MLTAFFTFSLMFTVHNRSSLDSALSSGMPPNKDRRFCMCPNSLDTWGSRGYVRSLWLSTAKRSRRRKMTLFVLYSFILFIVHTMILLSSNCKYNHLDYMIISFLCYSVMLFIFSSDMFLDISSIRTLINSYGVILYNLRSLLSLSMIQLNSTFASSLVDLVLILCFAQLNIASNFLISTTSRLRHMIICTIDSLRVRKSGFWKSW